MCSHELCPCRRYGCFLHFLRDSVKNGYSITTASSLDHKASQVASAFCSTINGVRPFFALFLLNV